MFTKTKDGIVLSLKIVPNASKNEIVGPHGDALKIKIAAAPEKGKANKALIAFLAKMLSIPQADIVLLKGTSSKHKKVLIQHVTLEHVKILASS